RWSRVERRRVSCRKIQVRPCVEIFYTGLPCRQGRGCFWHEQPIRLDGIDRPLRVDLRRLIVVWRAAPFGASFRFPLATWEVGYLNGHRPFRLGGGNGSKCPLTDFARLGHAPAGYRSDMQLPADRPSPIRYAASPRANVRATRFF